MPLTQERYPALVERALKLVTERRSVGASELATRLFGGDSPAWQALLTRVLAKEKRLRRTARGDWTVARAARASGDVGVFVLGAGPKPWRHPIVAIGAARLSGDEVEIYETLVRPERGQRMPSYVASHGVRAEELESAPGLREAIAGFVEFAGQRRLVGLDVGLAAARLQLALRELGMPPLSNELGELASTERTSKPELRRLAGEAGLTVPARPTVGALAALSLRLAERADGRLGGSALDAAAWRTLLDGRRLAEMPEGPGVYRFLDATGRVLYVGKATSLRERTGSYLSGAFPITRAMPGLVEATRSIGVDEMPSELAARMLEAQLIAEAKPVYNVQRQPGGMRKAAIAGPLIAVAPGVVMLVDAGGLRAAVPLAERGRRAARAALKGVQLRPPSDAGLAAVAVLHAALKRGEPGVDAWPLRRAR